jgi:hypothetical protein
VKDVVRFVPPLDAQATHSAENVTKARRVGTRTNSAASRIVAAMADGLRMDPLGVADNVA